MLPLHHAAYVAFCNGHPETHAPSSLARCSLTGLEAKTKKAFQGIALEGLVLDECRPL